MGERSALYCILMVNLKVQERYFEVKKNVNQVFRIKEEEKRYNVELTSTKLQSKQNDVANWVLI